MTHHKALFAGASLLALMSATFAHADAMSDLDAAAKKEGMLTVIALPHA